MADVILVSGSINAGKTTVSRLLARRIPRTAHVEVDALRAFVPWMPLEESIPLNLRNATAVARHFLEAGLHVVVDYPLGPEHHDRLTRELSGLADAIHGFVLAPPLKVALLDRGRRLDEWERDRIRVLYRQGFHDPGFGIAIDNGSQTPDETVAEILAHLGRA